MGTIRLLSAGQVTSHSGRLLPGSPRVDTRDCSPRPSPGAVRTRPSSQRPRVAVLAPARHDYSSGMREVAPKARAGCTAMFPLNGDTNARPNPSRPGKRRRCAPERLMRGASPCVPWTEMPTPGRIHLDQANDNVAPRKNASTKARQGTRRGCQREEGGGAESVWTRRTATLRPGKAHAGRASVCPLD